MINTELDKIRLVELDLKKSLEQAQSFNERLTKLLSLKIQEQRFKDNQCTLIETQLHTLQNNVKSFETHFLGINGQTKNLIERIKDVWTYNNENLHTNKIIDGILQDSHHFISKITKMNSDNDSFFTNVSKSREKCTSEYDPRSTSTSAGRIKNYTEPIQTDRQDKLLNNFRNHFITQPKKVQSSLIKKRSDNSNDVKSNSQNSSVKQRFSQTQTLFRKKNIDAQYSQIFRDRK